MRRTSETTPGRDSEREAEMAGKISTTDQSGEIPPGKLIGSPKIPEPHEENSESRSPLMLGLQRALKSEN